MATVSVLANIFNKKWLNYNEDEISCLVVQKFHIDLDLHLKIDDLQINQGDDIDRKTCIASVRLQLYCALIGICYTLRKQTWFKLIEYVSCGQQLELNEGNLERNEYTKLKCLIITFECIILNQYKFMGSSKNCVWRCFKVQHQHYWRIYYRI